MSFKPTVIVIGGSFAGIGVAKALLAELPSAKVLLINPSEKVFFNIAAPRIFAKPTVFKPSQYLFDIKAAFRGYRSEAFEIVKDYASAIDTSAKTATTQGGAILHYDQLVIASGTTTASATGTDSTIVPFKTTNTGDIEDLIQPAQEAIANAKSILVIGGGPVGVEFAGELGERAGLRVTLVTQSDRLLLSLKASASKAARALLEKNEVKVRTNCKVVHSTQDPETKVWTATLDSGDTITADLCISTTGVLPNNSFIPTNILSKDGWVKVDATFKVMSEGDAAVTSVYAVGDITIHTPRLASVIPEQIPIVIANIKADITGRGARPTYKPKTSLTMMVPIGKSGGTGQIFSWVPWSWLVAKTKGKDFFISMAAGILGTK
ncbi:hypothetical protein EIK77_000516 [Talaromyces pinophilus]|nr:hypothetical protein EIK77_000516 [Talaromyces pinophilus]PCG90804.1 hypothetical protein PENOC_100270 [Penicillium occitanis (nom. inval.)]PCG94602.1 FAD-dependent pyridine nucleotide-disulfide oxidoreductase [Penicillium occitanis (nom. inval.)]